LKSHTIVLQKKHLCGVLIKPRPAVAILAPPVFGSRESTNGVALKATRYGFSS